jgi:hypothetical protein
LGKRARSPGGQPLSQAPFLAFFVLFVVGQRLFLGLSKGLQNAFQKIVENKYSFPLRRVAIHVKGMADDAKRPNVSW